MSRNKNLWTKLKLVAAGGLKGAPRWADIKKFGLKRARSRRIPSKPRRWRRDNLKI